MDDLTKNTNQIKVKRIAFNYIYNLLGYGIPLLLALFLIPILLSKLGTDKFGVLNLAWIVIGYFGFFDLGIGRALTKIISEKIGLNQLSDIPAFFWTSLIVMLMFSSFVSVCLFLLSEKIILSLLKIPVEIQSESIKAFYLLILSIPVVTTTAGIRGLLEAYQRFDIINVIRIILGVSSFLLPVLVLMFVNDLYWIIFSLVIVRILVWFLYLFSAFKLNPDLKLKIKFKAELIKPVFKLSGWMTLSNVTVPIIVYLDRILIASLISAAAVAYYATPYEVITKLLIVPSALTAVLFPTFAANYIRDKSSTIKLSDKAMKYIGLLLFPVISIIIIFSFELLNLWLGKEFAINSYTILQFLSIGIFFNSIAYIPFSLIEGIGRPDITAKLQLIELPFYILLMWIAIKNSGIYGAAFVYMIRMIIDCLLLIYFSKLITGNYFLVKFNLKFLYLFILLFILIFSITSNIFYVKVILSALMLFLFIYISWRYFLDNEDKSLIKSKLNIQFF
ncbi:Membrane protein [Ignavibacterium album JCM 16511]|uniref:Membrane protein n=1 Tax=Ignavibacterium album (strain DSM 19864 / JCM 16511 / NBRC 101810 / Mat9-16) TaxID=945713 RepID=I0AHJ5_IGNAJ|nr:flippase [Ignavibacterium album]AFH48452.1 Membrane protein [Ignavibacterium album JCM 16511]